MVVGWTSLSLNGGTSNTSDVCTGFQSYAYGSINRPYLQSLPLNPVNGIWDHFTCKTEPKYLLSPRKSGWYCMYNTHKVKKLL